jgi:hypothetical protein
MGAGAKQEDTQPSIESAPHEYREERVSKEVQNMFRPRASDSPTHESQLSPPRVEPSKTGISFDVRKRIDFVDAAVQLIRFRQGRDHSVLAAEDARIPINEEGMVAPGSPVEKQDSHVSCSDVEMVAAVVELNFLPPSERTPSSRRGAPSVGDRR